MPDPKHIHLIQALNMPPEKAISFFEAKGYAITWNWQEQLKLNHAQVFTVANAIKMSVLQDIRNELKKSLKEGIPFAEFRKNLEPRLKANGWWGYITDKTGKRVQLGSPHRLRTIYRTNMQSSYNVGRWKSFEDNKEDRPALQYVAILDGSTRDEHAALHGQTHPVDSDFWNVNAPPNGHNCRCRLRSLSKEQTARAGKSKPVKAKPDKGFESNLAKTGWKPEKQSFDADIWKLGGIK